MGVVQGHDFVRVLAPVVLTMLLMPTLFLGMSTLIQYLDASGHDLSHQLVLVGQIVSRFPKVPAIRSSGFSYSKKDCLTWHACFPFWVPPPRAGGDTMARFVRRKSARRLAISWLYQSTCRLNSAGHLAAPTD